MDRIEEPVGTIVEYGGVECPECHHSDRMHRKGFSPRDAGCMVRGARTSPTGRPLVCWCALTPDRIAAALDSQP
jgi:hypothetical protein